MPCLAHALCPVWPMPYARFGPCPMPYARQVPHLSEKGYNYELIPFLKIIATIYFWVCLQEFWNGAGASPLEKLIFIHIFLIATHPTEDCCMIFKNWY